MKTTLAIAVWVALGAGCATMKTDTGPIALASLEPTQGNSVRGTVTFTQRGAAVRVSAQLSGLKAGAEHGFHVHEKGDCGSGDGMSAGGHYNPAGTPHGPQAAVHHAGDMPNLTADANGNAKVEFEIAGISVGGSTADIIGKGLIVHRDADDYNSQPAGNAGPRLACAVIRRA